jgi:hypothetical protein
MKKFDFVGMLEAIQKYKITTLTMAPPIAVVCLPNIRPRLKRKYFYMMGECERNLLTMA